MALSKVGSNQIDSAATPTFAELDVDNVKVNGNTISSTNTNGNVTIDPAGTGRVAVTGSATMTGTDTFNSNATGSGILLKDSGVTSRQLHIAAPGSVSEAVIGTPNSHNLTFATNNTERMRIDTSGQVMIGTTTAAGQFTVTEGDATTVIDRVGTNVAGIKTGSGDDFCVGTADYTQAIRIKNNTGHVGIGTTAPNDGQLCVETSDNEQVAFFLNGNSQFNSNTLGISTSRNTTNGTYTHFQCSIHGVAVKLKVMDSGQVQNANGSYTSISDERMKENITDASSQWDDIKAVRLRNFNMIGDDLTQLGVVAQELEASGMTGLVGESDWYDVTANPDNEQRKYVKQSILYMKALGALQEAIAKIETLETKVAALEAG